MYFFSLFVLANSMAVKDRGDGAVLSSGNYLTAGMRDERRVAGATLVAPLQEAFGSLLQFTIQRDGIEQTPSSTATASVDTPWQNLHGNLGTDFGNIQHHRWDNISIADQNWCRHFAEHESFENEDCDTGNPDLATCNARFAHVTGQPGNFTQCTYDAASTTCIAGALHVCPWTFFMHDLMETQHNESQNCWAKLLEAKRSLDGLLDSVNVTFRDLMAQNDIINAMNTTIRSLLEDQQRAWSDYIDEQENCVSEKNASLIDDLQPIYNDILELQAIADPGVRSAVDFQRNSGYQEEARDGYDQTYGTWDPTSTSFLEAAASVDLSADSAACTKFASLVQRVQSKRGGKLAKQPDVDCHQLREKLNNTFRLAYQGLTQEHEAMNKSIFEEYSECLSTATYNYKVAVEGAGGIDQKIQAAARQIHEAQKRIAVLEPRLHDVENAVSKMRVYVRSLSGSCNLTEDISSNLRTVQEMILNISECPGRNDFYLTIPHWQRTDVPTPAPTPWHDRLGAPATASQLHPAQR